MAAYKNKTTQKKTVSKQANKGQSAGKPLVQLVDNRPTSVSQSKLLNEMNNGATSKDAPIQKKGNNTGLPNNLKSGIENISGHSMDNVKVHYNSSKPAQLSAHAYAQGENIHIASGQEKHLPHEAWHVVQQKQGRVKPTLQLKGKVNINDNAGLEKEADVMGAKALQFADKRPASVTQMKSQNAIGSIVVQRAWHNVVGQNGQFEGDAAYHHLHRVGGNEHYRYGLGGRTRYIHGGVANYANIQAAIAACNGAHPADTGKAACLAYLEALLADTPEPVVVPKEKGPKPPPPKKGGKKKKGGGKKGKKLNALGDALMARNTESIF